MAGNITRKQAETFWRQYNKDGNDELTADEVKECLTGVYDTVDDFDVNEKFKFFGQTEAKTLTKEEFIKGIMRTEKSALWKKMFSEMDKDGSGSLSKDELETGMAAQGITGEQASVIVDELEYDGDGNYSIDEFIDVIMFSEYFSQTYCA